MVILALSISDAPRKRRNKQLQKREDGRSSGSVPA